MLKNNQPTKMLKQTQKTKVASLAPTDSWDNDVNDSGKSSTKINLDSDNEDTELDSEGDDSDNESEEEEEDSEGDDSDNESEEEEEDSEGDDSDNESDEEEEEEEDEESDDEDDPTKDVVLEFINDFGNMPLVNEDVLRGLYAMGVNDPHASQQITNSLIKHRTKSFVVDASTGSGKTIAFGLPVASLVNQKVQCLQVVIIAPTHHLALQIYEEMEKLVAFSKISLALHRGAGNFQEGQAPGERDTSRTYITNRPTNVLGREQIIVGTPGKLLALFSKRNVFDRRYVRNPCPKEGYRVQLNARTVQQVVLDEGDGLLKPSSSRSDSRGMSDDVNAILEGIKKDQPFARFLLFSATAAQDTGVEDFMRMYNAQYTSFKVKRSQGKSVGHYYVNLDTEDAKPATLLDILENKKHFNSVFVFCNTKRGANYITNALEQKEYSVGQVSSNMTQRESDSMLRQFKAHQLKILVTTNSCARGIDVPSVDLVINMDVPDHVTYAHRAGRAGRFSKYGTCITMVLSMGKETPREILGIQDANHCLFSVLSREVMDS
jgi:ATP-dependent RNA helicase DeaD